MRLLPCLSLLASGCLILLLGCGGKSGADTQAPAITTQPLQVAVQAGGTALFQGAASGMPTPTLQWERSADGQAWVSISGATGGSCLIAANAEDHGTQFRFRAINGVGAPAVSTPARLDVQAIKAFTAEPPSIVCGQHTTLSASFTTGTAHITPGDHAVVNGGHVDVAPTQTTAYTLTLTGPAGVQTRSVEVVVRPAPPAIDTFQATPSTIISGASATLTASYTGGTGIVMPGNISLPSGGSLAVQPTATTTYTLTVTGPGGKDARTTTLQVQVPAPTITTFTATPSIIKSGDGSTLAATYIGGSGVVMPGNLSLPSGGSLEVKPLTTTTYTLTVTGTGGTDTRTATVQVRAPAPAITAFTAMPSTIKPGAGTTLTATYTGGTGTITPGNLSIASGGSVTVTPTATTSYTLTVAAPPSAPETRTLVVQVEAGTERIIRGTIHFIRLSAKGEESIPYVSSGTHELVQEVAPGTWKTVPVTHNADGSWFSSASIQPGPYWERTGGGYSTRWTYHLNDPDTQDTTLARVGRGGTVQTFNLPIHMDLSGLPPSQADDEIELWELEHDLGRAVIPLNSGGDSRQSLDLNWSSLFSTYLLDATQGDRLFAGLTRRREYPGQGSLYSLDCGVELKTLTMAPWNNPPISMVFGPLPTETIRWNIAGRRFIEALTPGNPEVLAPPYSVPLHAGLRLERTTASGIVAGQVFTKSLVTFRGSASKPEDLQDIDLGDIPYGNPRLGAPTFSRAMFVNSMWGSTYTVEGATSGTPGYFNIQTFLATLPTADKPVAPLVGQVNSPRIDGLDLTQPQVNIALEPTISWTAPTIGKADWYSVSITHLVCTNKRTRTESTQYFYFPTPQTSLKVPTGVLKAGESYYVTVTAFAVRGNDSGSASKLSGLIKVRS